jgi:hypothetical protein
MVLWHSMFFVNLVFHSYILLSCRCAVERSLVLFASFFIRKFASQWQVSGAHEEHQSWFMSITVFLNSSIKNKYDKECYFIINEKTTTFSYFYHLNYVFHFQGSMSPVHNILLMTTNNAKLNKRIRDDYIQRLRNITATI